MWFREDKEAGSPASNYLATVSDFQESSFSPRNADRKENSPLSFKTDLKAESFHFKVTAGNFKYGPLVMEDAEQLGFF